MNLVLIHLGGSVPSYFWICVDQVRRYYSGKLWVYCDAALDRAMCEKYDVLVFDPAALADSPRIREFSEVSFIRHYGAFWEYAFKRMYVLEEIIRLCQMTRVIHIENDVLIYSNPETLEFPSGKMCANRIGPKFATYAYTWIPDYQAIKEVNDASLSMLKLGGRALTTRYGENMVNEMLVARDLMGQDILGELPSLPPAKDVFDPAAYGQWCFGTPATQKPGWAEHRHDIGHEILEGNIDVTWQTNEGKREPYVISHTGEVLSKIHNLHMHCKNLELGR